MQFQIIPIEELDEKEQNIYYQRSYKYQINPLPTDKHIHVYPISNKRGETKWTYCISKTSYKPEKCGNVTFDNWHDASETALKNIKGIHVHYWFLP